MGDKPALKPHYSLDSQQAIKLKPFNRFFSSNPFTAPSYELLLRLALIYPILSFLLVWAVGGDGTVAGLSFLGNEADNAKITTSQRWQLIGVTFVLPVIVILFLKQKSIKVQALFLSIVSITLFFHFKDELLAFWFTFILLFIPKSLFSYILKMNLRILFVK